MGKMDDGAISWGGMLEGKETPDQPSGPKGLLQRSEVEGKMTPKQVRAQSGLCLWMGRRETLGTPKQNGCATSSRCHHPRTSPGAVGTAVLTRSLLYEKRLGVEPVVVVEVGQVEGSRRDLGREAAILPRLKESHPHWYQPHGKALECHLLSSLGCHSPHCCCLPPSCPATLGSCKLVPPRLVPCSAMQLIVPFLSSLTRGSPQESPLGSSALFGMTLGL